MKQRKELVRKLIKEYDIKDTSDILSMFKELRYHRRNVTRRT
jgi:hypothetical protein